MEMPSNRWGRNEIVFHLWLLVDSEHLELNAEPLLIFETTVDLVDIYDLENATECPGVLFYSPREGALAESFAEEVLRMAKYTQKTALFDVLQEAGAAQLRAHARELLIAMLRTDLERLQDLCIC